MADHHRRTERRMTLSQRLTHDIDRRIAALERKLTIAA
jgi:hypothetical protein